MNDAAKHILRPVDSAFRDSFRSSLLLVFVVLTLSLGALLAVYIFDRNSETERVALAYVKRHEDYVLGLALHENWEAIDLFIQQSNLSQRPIKFQWSDKPGRVGNSYRLAIGGQTLGYINSEFRLRDVVSLELIFLYLAFTLAVFIASFQFYRVTQSFLRKSLIAPLTAIGDVLGKSTQLSEVERVEEIASNIREVQEIKEHILRSAREITRSEELARAAEVANALNQLAAKVSHDIRSPLGALRMMTNEFQGLPIEVRTLVDQSIGRIQSIADEMLQGSRAPHQVRNLSPQKENAFVPYVLERLISEKAWELRNRVSIQLKLVLDFTAYEAFSEINFVELQRIISNLVNNSVEALSNDSEELIIIRVTSNEQWTIIEVNDRGRGIPSHVLHRIGERGFSYGKNSAESGSGLGLFLARESIQAWGGSLEIDSTENKGTSVRILLPKTGPAAWLPLRPDWKTISRIVVVDDLPEVFEFWKRVASEKKLALECFSTGLDFTRRFQEGGWNDSNEKILFVIDYNLGRRDMSGVDLIKQCLIQNEAILVTAGFFSSELQELCKSNGIKMFPKGLEIFLTADQNIGSEILYKTKRADGFINNLLFNPAVMTPKVDQEAPKDG